MSQSADNPSANPHSRWQFSLRGLLIFTISIAIGAAVVKTNMLSWLGTIWLIKEDVKIGYVGGLIAVLVFWMVLGILYQVRDLRSSLASNGDLSSDQRWGAWFEIFWRLVVAILITLNYLMSFLIDRGALILPKADSGIWMIEGVIREAILVVLLLAVVGSVPCVQRRQVSTLLYRVLCLVAYAVAGVFCLYRWMDETIVYYLVHIATFGIDSAQPPKLASFECHHYNRNISLFFWISLASGVIVLINWAVLVRLTRQWSAGIGRRLMLAGLLVLGIACSGIYVIWVETSCLRRISPFFAQVLNWAPGYSYILATFLVVILVTMLTYRMTVNNEFVADASQVSWRLKPNKYYHEKRLVLLLLAIAVVWLHLKTYFEAKNAFQSMTGWQNYSHPFSLREFVESWFGNPSSCLLLSLVLLALYRVFARRNDFRYPGAELPRINWSKFITVWIITAAFVISGAMVLVWMSFALWFNPWWRGRWP